MNYCKVSKFLATTISILLFLFHVTTQQSRAATVFNLSLSVTCVVYDSVGVTTKLVVFSKGLVITEL